MFLEFDLDLKGASQVQTKQQFLAKSFQLSIESVLGCSHRAAACRHAADHLYQIVRRHAADHLDQIMASAANLPLPDD